MRKREIETLQCHEIIYKGMITIGLEEWCKEEKKSKYYSQRKENNMVLARYSKLHTLPFVCSNCRNILTGDWFRCLMCFDTDVCEECVYKKKITCFNGKIKHFLFHLRLVTSYL